MKLHTLDKNIPLFDRADYCQRSEANAKALCDQLGIKKNKRLFDPTPTDLAFGLDLAQRTRENMEMGRHEKVT
jgi:hypothetical protein